MKDGRLFFLFVQRKDGKICVVVSDLPMLMYKIEYAIHSLFALRFDCAKVLVIIFYGKSYLYCSKVNLI